MIATIDAMCLQLPPGDLLKLLLGSAAFHFCQNSSHPKRPQLEKLSLTILSRTAYQQGISTQDRFDNWFVQNRLDDPNYFLPAIDDRLVKIIGDGWLFDPRQIGGDPSVPQTTLNIDIGD